MEPLTSRNIRKYKGQTGVYKLQIHNHIYIGSSINLQKRLSKHLWELKNNKHFNRKLQNCYNKYGKHELYFEILETCTQEVLLEREAFYITNEHADVNIIINPNCIKRDINFQERVQEALHLYYATHRAHNIKTVYQYTQDGHFIKQWESITDAANFYNTDITNISACCRGKAFTAVGYRWSFSNMSCLPVTIKKLIPNRSVIQLNSKQEIVFVWDRLSRIYQYLHITPKTIKQYIQSGNLYKGFYWRWWTENTRFSQCDEAVNPESLKLPRFPLNNKSTSKPCFQYNLDGQFIREWPSVSEAERYYHKGYVKGRLIALCCSYPDKYKSAYNFQWSYIKKLRIDKYNNKSAEAVNKPIEVFNAITGEFSLYQSIAEAVRNICGEKDFANLCAQASSAANHHCFFNNIYLIKHQSDQEYILPKRRKAIYNTKYNTIYANLKEASKKLNLTIWKTQQKCKIHKNPELIYVLDSARVKLCEAGKPFE